MKTATTLLVGSIVCIFVLTGCSSDKRTSVSGTITMNGEPLSHAAIEFIPENQDILNTRAGVNTQSDGTFNIPKSRGLEPGDYLVTIYAAISFDSQTKEPATVETSPTNIITKVLTPPEYNEKTTQRFTVSAKGKNVYNCDVISKVTRDFGP